MSNTNLFLLGTLRVRRKPVALTGALLQSLFASSRSRNTPNTHPRSTPIPSVINSLLLKVTTARRIRLVQAVTLGRRWAAASRLSHTRLSRLSRTGLSHTGLCHIWLSRLSHAGLSRLSLAELSHTGLSQAVSQLSEMGDGEVGVVGRAWCPAPQAVPVVLQVQGGVVDHADDDHGEGHALQKDGGVAHHDDVG